mgnify:CR=1 FL=1
MKRSGTIIGYLLLVPLLLCLTYQNRLHESNYKVAQDPLDPVVSAERIADEYDVIVAGTDPEGIMAAISASRNGLKVLLVENRDRSVLGGLMTLGWLNTLDLNKAPVKYRLWKDPVYLNKGLFQEWYNGIQGTSFDVNRAANLFNRMVSAEDNIDLLMHARTMEPVLEGNQVAGMRLETGDGRGEIVVRAKAIIDATRDADVAAAAGAAYTFGREDLGEPEARMAVTLVFKLSGVTDEVWRKMKRFDNTGFDSRSIWGYQQAREYVSSDSARVQMRNLNIGREDGDTVLINSMQIYGIDPLDPESVSEGLRIGEKEAPLIVEFLKTRFEQFRSVEFAGTAPELYVRETRHILGEYRLTMADLLDNRDHWDAIAYGAYEVDIQSLDANNKGTILMVPKQYGVPFRSLVPLKVDGLLVVGRSASFDTLPHGSARVIPLGMATGEAAGAAVKLALERGVSLRELSLSREAMAELRQRLTKQGMDLTMRSFAPPAYTKHEAYPGLAAAASLALASGGYGNDWKLDETTNPQRFLNQMRTLQKRYPELIRRTLTASSVGGASAKEALGLDLAAYMIAQAADLAADRQTALQALAERGWIRGETIANLTDRERLTNGDAFMLVRDLMQYGAGVVFE